MNGETEEALGAIYKETGGIELDNSSNGAFNITVCAIQCCSDFVSDTDQLRGRRPSCLANPLLSCFVSYCQTCAFFIVHHLPLLLRLTSREQGLLCFCLVLSKRPVPNAVSPH